MYNSHHGLGGGYSGFGGSSMMYGMDNGFEGYGGNSLGSQYNGSYSGGYGYGLGQGYGLNNSPPSGLDNALMSVNRSLGVLQNLAGTTSTGAQSMMQLAQSYLLLRLEATNGLSPNGVQSLSQRQQHQYQQMIATQQHSSRSENPNENDNYTHNKQNGEPEILTNDSHYSSIHNSTRRRPPNPGFLQRMKTLVLHAIPPFPSSWVQLKGLSLLAFGIDYDDDDETPSLSDTQLASHFQNIAITSTFGNHGESGFKNEEGSMTSDIHTNTNPSTSLVIHQVSEIQDVTTSPEMPFSNSSPLSQDKEEFQKTGLEPEKTAQNMLGTITPRLTPRAMCLLSVIRNRRWVRGRTRWLWLLIIIALWKGIREAARFFVSSPPGTLHDASVGLVSRQTHAKARKAWDISSSLLPKQRDFSAASQGLADTTSLGLGGMSGIGMMNPYGLLNGAASTGQGRRSKLGVLFEIAVAAGLGYGIWKFASAIFAKVQANEKVKKDMEQQQASMQQQMQQMQLMQQIYQASGQQSQQSQQQQPQQTSRVSSEELSLE